MEVAVAGRLQPAQNGVSNRQQRLRGQHARRARGAYHGVCPLAAMSNLLNRRRGPASEGNGVAAPARRGTRGKQRGLKRVHRRWSV